MAITWDYSKKCGEATFQTRYEGVEPGSYTVNLYEGNYFLIMINESTDEDGTEMAALNSFFCDEEHMNRCLGLSGELDNIYKTDNCWLSKIRLNKAKCRNYKKILAAFSEAFDDIEIEVFTEGEKIWREYKEPKPIVPDVRMRELAESAISYINDEMRIQDFLEDRFIDLTDEEKSYFGIYDYDEEVI